MSYCNESNYLNTPLFQEKLLFQYPNTYTLWSLNGVAECLLAFDCLCGATVMVTEHLLAYYRRFQMSTRLRQSFPNIYWTPTVTVELERGLPNVHQPLRVSAELERGLENVY